jgi:hypothetical protein
MVDFCPFCHLFFFLYLVRVCFHPLPYLGILNHGWGSSSIGSVGRFDLISLGAAHRLVPAKHLGHGLRGLRQCHVPWFMQTPGIILPLQRFYELLLSLPDSLVLVISIYFDLSLFTKQINVDCSPFNTWFCSVQSHYIKNTVLFTINRKSVALQALTNQQKLNIIYYPLFFLSLFFPLTSDFI